MKSIVLDDGLVSTLQIVLLVGYGPSAFDIAVDILAVAKEVHVAVKENQFGVKFQNLIYHDMVCNFEFLFFIK
jgi:cation diffusion facilitator CzcD-associated flavoprotein CzcO